MKLKKIQIGNESKIFIWNEDKEEWTPIENSEALWGDDDIIKEEGH